MTVFFERDSRLLYTIMTSHHKTSHLLHIFQQWWSAAFILYCCWSRSTSVSSIRPQTCRSKWIVTRKPTVSFQCLHGGGRILVADWYGVSGTFLRITSCISSSRNLISSSSSLRDVRDGIRSLKTLDASPLLTRSTAIRQSWQRCTQQNCHQILGGGSRMPQALNRSHRNLHIARQEISTSTSLGPGCLKSMLEGYSLVSAERSDKPQHFSLLAASWARTTHRVVFSWTEPMATHKPQQ